MVYLEDVSLSYGMQLQLDTLQALRDGKLTPPQAAQLLPDRSTLGMIWRYLAAAPAPLTETPMCLCRKIVRWTGSPLSLGQMLTCLDIFADVGLLEVARLHNDITIRLLPATQKADLNTSRTLQKLRSFEGV